ncbi:helix-turn-helix transcriptional regulator [Clostridium sp. YIM B02506]|uniref:helix-turn-helix transcriptional regulator n=1 Tax=Clostridium sp. YIM B02506 TaxID=2910680 RepID=UPI001EEE4372|nr:helix-turn-helix transcriptional regulator [Clostridium sp. YIM B02506]
MIKYKIKAFRVGQGIKANELSRRIGITRQYLRLIENGEAKNPSRTIMKKIADELGTSVEELFF